MVASVFFNRLAEQMDLSSCPALEYAPGYHRPFLIAKGLELDSPYNTYRHMRGQKAALVREAAPGQEGAAGECRAVALDSAALGIRRAAA
jgi:hypothetical protein